MRDRGVQLLDTLRGRKACEREGGREGRRSTSVTRFGEISPLWQEKLSLWQYLEGLLSLWQNFEPTLVNVYASGAIFYCCKKPNIEKIFSHLVTLWRAVALSCKKTFSLLALLSRKCFNGRTSTFFLFSAHCKKFSFLLLTSPPVREEAIPPFKFERLHFAVR